ncbi:MAG: efflux transporter periplasmic adaptor subunit, partial [Gammaproteobacteria bacterium]
MKSITELFAAKSLFAAAAGSLALLVGGCDRGSGPPPAPPPPKVVVAKVSQKTIPIVLHFSGTLQAVRSINIIPRVGGFIEKRYFVEGTRVSKDDPLYLIDPRTYEASLASYKAQLERDQANYTYWKEQVARNTRLQ